MAKKISKIAFMKTSLCGHHKFEMADLRRANIFCNIKDNFDCLLYNTLDIYYSLRTYLHCKRTCYIYFGIYKKHGKNMKKNEKQTPFRDFTNLLKEIKEKLLSKEQIEKINLIIKD